MRKLNIIVSLVLSAMVMAAVGAGCTGGDVQYPERQAIGDVDRSAIDIVEDSTAVTGDIRWEVLEVRDLGTNIVDEYGAALVAREGRFIYISFEVENMGDAAMQMFDVKVVDDKGDLYSVCTEAYGYFAAPAVCTVQDILPGTARTFNASFDIPAGSEDILMEVTDLEIPPGEKAYIDLGI